MKKRETPPEKNRARMAVMRAIKSGRLARPTECENCGAEPGEDARGESLLDAHHEDYSNQLEVRWLCTRCHLRHHRINPEQRRRVHQMWHDGASIQAIADATGRSWGAVAAMVADMREDGWDLPYRRQPAQPKHPELLEERRSA